MIKEAAARGTHHPAPTCLFSYLDCDGLWIQPLKVAHRQTKTKLRKPQPLYAKHAASAQLFQENPISYILS